MALGQELLRNLKLGDTAATIDRWLVHHLAELLVQAKEATGPAKVEAETRAVDVILRLWARRRILPETADPLGGYRKTIEVLSRLMPDKDPWTALAHRGGQEQILFDLFDCMARVVVGGLLLTLAKVPRLVTLAEEATMEQEELVLREHLDWWTEALGPELPNPPIGWRVVEPENFGEDSHETLDKDKASAMPPPADTTEDEDTDEEEDIEDKAHSEQDWREAITANLEQLQEQLANLIDRWKLLPVQPGSGTEVKESSE